MIKNLFDVIHYFKKDTNGETFDPMSVELPSQFTYPFHYTPHPLVVLAANEVNAYLQSRTDWHEELSHGKMFGVLLVQTQEHKIGYLAAFSGNLAGSNHHDFFVPPVYDLLRPGDFFKIEENNISAINRRIKEVTTSESYMLLRRTTDAVRLQAKEELTKAKNELKAQKSNRDEERKAIDELLDRLMQQDAETRNATITAYKNRLQEMIKESQFQKAEYKRLEKRLKEKVALQEEALHKVEDEVTQLRQERKNRSAALQLKLFQHFRMLNAKGEVKDLCQIFEETRQSVPPAGSGECALPKLLQYAYQNDLKPLAFGEFWWGESPKDEIRHHGQFYPSCKGKCEPILKHMLVGLAVEPNPLSENRFNGSSLKIIYEDEWIVAIEKPAGMLSTPGKECIESVSERLQKMYPEATGPLLVHRLDMATSGILLAAKNKEIHAALQSLFEARKVRKIYTALLDAVPKEKQGCINLPLCLNPLDRPRQMVSYEHGKEAITLYEVIATKNNQALVRFDLLTGRTHQIRVHAAHPLGLNCPIKGDDLYGKHADRLYLHATEVIFTHPITGKKIALKSNVPFGL